MESSFVNQASLPTIQNLPKPQKTTPKSVFPPINPPMIRFLLPLTTSSSPHSHQKCLSSLPKTTSAPIDTLQNQIPIHKNTPSPKLYNTHLINSLKNHASVQKTASHLRNSLQFSFGLMSISLPFPFSAIPAETTIEIERISSKINIESTLISIDDFFNRNPFFVAGVTFVWLIVIPVTEYYLKKCKPVSAIDAFRKLRDDPNSQLLDIRKNKSVQYMGSPKLKILKKMTAWVEFREGEEDGFVKEVKERFRDPDNTVLCVLDNFDGNSMKVAQLLFDNGFKEAYAIKGGLRGKDGWQEIQDTLLPPSMHVYPRKRKGGTSNRQESSERIKQESENGQIAISSEGDLAGNGKPENGCIKLTETAPQAKFSVARPSSPYPNYPDLKPPSSPTPSKP